MLFAASSWPLQMLLLIYATKIFKKLQLKQAVVKASYVAANGCKKSQSCFLMVSLLSNCANYGRNNLSWQKISGLFWNQFVSPTWQMEETGKSIKINPFFFLFDNRWKYWCYSYNSACIYIKGIDDEYNVTEKMAYVSPLTKSFDLYEVKKYLKVILFNIC